jgi:hypothetical protein
MIGAHVNITIIYSHIRRYEMKRYVFVSVLLLNLLAVPAVFSQEPPPDERQLQMRQQEMDLQQRQAKMDMEREMQKLDLEQRRMKIEHARAEDRERDGKGALGVLLLVCLIVHILVAIWVYMDIRQLNRGSGIWIVIALLTGLFGGLVYAIVRIGDARQKG